MKFTIRDALLLTLLSALPLAVGRVHAGDGMSVCFLPFAWFAWRLSAALSNPLVRIGLAALAGALGTEVVYLVQVAFFLDPE